MNEDAKQDELESVSSAPSTAPIVTRYLVLAYDMTEDAAKAAVAKHAAVVQKAGRLGSFAYAAGDEIAELEEL